MLIRDFVKRAFSCLCPRCGEGRIFVSWAVPHEECVQCGFPFRRREPDTWFFMYMSTAGMTGIFIALFFVISKTSMLARVLVPVSAVFAFFLTLEIRKSMAFMAEYWMNPEKQ